MNFVNLKNEDKEIFSLVEKELNRQQQGISLLHQKISHQKL